MNSAQGQALAGIRREDKNRWEKRAPVTPFDVRELTLKAPVVRFRLQPSRTRIFPDDAYRAAGAEISEDLSPCRVIFGVKEVPAAQLIPEGVYAFFAHVIKGQPRNMPMLERLLRLGCTLIDYEKIADEKGRRLIFFGRHAGIAGMIDTLWALGQRIALEGLESSLSSIKRAFEYPDMRGAKNALSAVAERIRTEGIPESLRPLVLGMAGYGNVSKGAQEILDLLPVKPVKPEELPLLPKGTRSEANAMFKVVFEEHHMAAPEKAERAFDLQDYYRHPERYRPCFEAHLPYLTVLVNCIYWDERYPRLVTKEYLRRTFARALRPRLRIIGDISCDIAGAVECTVRCTTPHKPVFVYLPVEDRVVEGLLGEGVVVLAVDNLPAEFPTDASTAFGRMLSPFVPDMLLADYSTGFDDLKLAHEVKKAVIVHRGKLTPEYAYLTEHLHKAQESRLSTQP